MFFTVVHGGAADGGEYAVKFFGTNSSWAGRAAGLDGVSDGKFGALSFFFTVNSWPGATQTIFDGEQGGLQIFLSNARQLFIDAYRWTGVSRTLVCRMWSPMSLSTGQWYHAMASFDVRTTSQVHTHLYIDETSSLNSFRNLTQDVSWTTNSVYFGRSWGTPINLTAHFCLSEFYLNTDEYIDLSSESNRRKFITADVTAAYLGSDGSAPTGSTPAIYIPGNDIEVNKGYGGNFTITGSVGLCASAPSG